MPPPPLTLPVTSGRGMAAAASPGAAAHCAGAAGAEASARRRREPPPPSAFRCGPRAGASRPRGPTVAAGAEGTGPGPRDRPNLRGGAWPGRGLGLPSPPPAGRRWCHAQSQRSGYETRFFFSFVFSCCLTLPLKGLFASLMAYSAWFMRFSLQLLLVVLERLLAQS